MIFIAVCQGRRHCGARRGKNVANAGAHETGNPGAEAGLHATTSGLGENCCALPGQFLEEPVLVPDPEILRTATVCRQTSARKINNTLNKENSLMASI